MKLKTLEERATKITDLIKLMDETFPNNKGHHDKVCIMAAIQDAYKQGIDDGFAGKIEADNTIKPNQKGG